MKRKIILRADGNKTIGFGHIYRVISLAQILKNDFDCKFAIANPDEFIRDQVKRINLELIDLPAINYVSPNEKYPKDEIPFDLEKILTGNEIVVTDGYWFGENYQKAIIEKGCKLFCIDDLAQHHFVANGVINHALGIKEEQYDLAPGTKLLTGYDFLLLRSDFFKKINHHTRMDKKRVLITMGGSDLYDLNYFFVDLILNTHPDVLIDVILPASINEKSLNNWNAKQMKNKNLNLHFHITAPKVVNLIDNVTHAIVSASTVLLEVNARGLKPLTGFYTDNQKGIYYGAIKSGMAIGLGNLLEIKNLDINIKLNEYLSGNAFINNRPDRKNIIKNYKELFSSI